MFGTDVVVHDTDDVTQGVNNAATRAAGAQICAAYAEHFVCRVWQQSQAESHMDKGREVARIATGVPLINTKHRIDLPGKRAKLRINSTEPEFYFRPVDGRQPHISLLRLDVNGDKRAVESVSTNVADISTTKGHEISLLSWDAAQGLTRFTVEEKLEPGEYAISEGRTDGEVDLYLWDFGLDAPPGE